VDWSLLGCGRGGHVTYAPAEAELRDQLTARTASGLAWRCLRCGAFVAGEPQASGPASEAPSVRRGKEVRSALILRIFAVERFARGLLVAVAAFAFWQFEGSRSSVEAAFDRELPIVRTLFRQFGYNIDHSKLVGLIQHALTLSSRTISLLATGLAIYAGIELIEAAGLWLGRRWGEYFAMVATSLGLPLEIYDLTVKVSATALVLLAINLALVLYLVITKRLFGVRGGKHAYEARLRSESVLESARKAIAAREAADSKAVIGSEAVPANKAVPASKAVPATKAGAASHDEAPPGAAVPGRAASDLPGPDGSEQGRGDPRGTATLADAAIRSPHAEPPDS
jgi:uncharacterized membrane protein (DUF2068 family)